MHVCSGVHVCVLGVGVCLHTYIYLVTVFTRVVKLHAITVITVIVNTTTT
jgi:hypothetical protein